MDMFTPQALKLRIVFYLTCAEWVRALPAALAVSQIFAMLFAYLKIWDSCAKIFSLFPPQAAVEYFAPQGEGFTPSVTS